MKKSLQRRLVVVYLERHIEQLKDLLVKNSFEFSAMQRATQRQKHALNSVVKKLERREKELNKLRMPV